MEPIFSQFRTLCADAVSGVLEKVAKKYDLPFEDLRTEFVLPILSGQALVPSVVAAPVPTFVSAPPPVVTKPDREPDMCTARAVRGMCTRKALPGTCFCKLHGRMATGEPAFKKTKTEENAEPVAEISKPVPEPVPEVPKPAPEPAPEVPKPVPEPVAEPVPEVPKPAPEPVAEIPKVVPEIPKPAPAESEDTVMEDVVSSDSSESSPRPPPPKRSDIRKTLRIKMKAAPIVSIKDHKSIFAAAPDDIEIF